MNPLPQERVQQTVQIVLAILESDDCKVAGSMTEGAVSGKSLLRGILKGQLVICEAGKPPPKESEKSATAKKVVKKKVAKKVAKKS